MGIASALNRLRSNGQTLASRWRSSYQTHDHLHVSLHGVNLLDETFYLHNNTPAEPQNIHQNDRTSTLDQGFQL